MSYIAAQAFVASSRPSRLSLLYRYVDEQLSGYQVSVYSHLPTCCRNRFDSTDLAFENRKFGVAIFSTRIFIYTLRSLHLTHWISRAGTPYEYSLIRTPTPAHWPAYISKLGGLAAWLVLSEKLH